MVDKPVAGDHVAQQPTKLIRFGLVLHQRHGFVGYQLLVVCRRLAVECLIPLRRIDPDVPDSKDLISDWRAPMSCGNFNVATGKCGGKGS